MKSLIRSISLLCILLISVFLKQDTESEYFLPLKAYSSFITDYNHDGFNDIIVGHQSDFNTPGLTIMKNSSWGNFEISDTTKIFNGGTGEVLSIDVNNDGWNDIVTFRLDTTSGVLNHYIRVYYNYFGTFPNNNFADFNLQSSATFNGMNYGDINGDGFVDLVVYSLNSGFWDVLYNNGNGGFLTPAHYYITEPSAIFCADLVSDGRDDVIVVGASTIIYWSYTYGFHAYVLDTSYMQFGAVVDFDGDGKKDILIDDGFYTLRIFKNLGNKTFQQLPDRIFPSGCGPFNVSDFNNDGYPDLIFPGTNGHVIWYNQGNFQIADSQFVAIPNYGASNVTVSCADLDNNAFNDIITVRLSVLPYPEVDIRFNDGDGNFIPDPIVGIDDKKDISTIEFKSYPNPFKDETCFQFYLTKPGFVKLSVYDLQGKLVTCLFNQMLKTGKQTRLWNLRDIACQSCKPGAYICSLIVNGKIYCNLKLFKID
ncbi:MAG: T9SS type A sorting domain-containing protein [Bacteroidetes bacterium]|nr:T9SS type A sorting domain-containing protein [Bacteroidota bacterium]